MVFTGLKIKITDNPLASLLATSCYTRCSFEDEETDMSHYCGIVTVVLPIHASGGAENLEPGTTGEVPSQKLIVSV